MSDERQADPFAPPEISTEVCCLHCHETYDSWQIEWRTKISDDGVERSFWCCPMPGCDGIGFGFDILPTDPNYQDEHGGWIHDEDAEDDEDEWSEEDSDWNEAERTASEMELEENIPWDDDDRPDPPRKPPASDSDFPFSAN